MILRAATTEDIPAIARVHVDTWRSTYSGIIPEEYLANLSYKQRENSWNQILSLPPYEYFTYSNPKWLYPPPAGTTIYQRQFTSSR
jgi:hypothetical protein